MDLARRQLADRRIEQAKFSNKISHQQKLPPQATVDEEETEEDDENNNYNNNNINNLHSSGRRLKVSLVAANTVKRQEEEQQEDEDDMTMDNSAVRYSTSNRIDADRANHQIDKPIPDLTLGNKQDDISKQIPNKSIIREPIKTQALKADLKDIEPEARLTILSGPKEMMSKSEKVHRIENISANFANRETILPNGNDNFTPKNHDSTSFLTIDNHHPSNFLAPDRSNNPTTNEARGDELFALAGGSILILLLLLLLVYNWLYRRKTSKQKAGTWTNRLSSSLSPTKLLLSNFSPSRAKKSRTQKRDSSIEPDFDSLCQVQPEDKLDNQLFDTAAQQKQHIQLRVFNQAAAADDQEIVHLESIEHENEEEEDKKNCDQGKKLNVSSIVILKRKLARSSLVIAAKSHTKPRVKLISAKVKKFIDDEAAELRSRQSSQGQDTTDHSKRGWFPARVYAALINRLATGSGSESSGNGKPDTELVERSSCNRLAQNETTDNQLEVRIEMGESNTDERGQMANQLTVQVEGPTIDQIQKLSPSPIQVNGDPCSSISACSLYSHSPLERERAACGCQTHQQQQQQQQQLQEQTSETNYVNPVGNERLFAATSQRDIDPANLRCRSQGHSPYQLGATQTSSLRPCCSASPSAMMKSGRLDHFNNTGNNLFVNNSSIAEHRAFSDRLLSTGGRLCVATTGTATAISETNAFGCDSFARPRARFSTLHSGKCSQRMKRHYENYYDEERGDAFRCLTASIGMDLGFGFDNQPAESGAAIHLNQELLNCSRYDQQIGDQQLNHSTTMHSNSGNSNNNNSATFVPYQATCACCRRQSQPKDILLNANLVGQANQYQNVRPFVGENGGGWCESASELLSSASTSLGGSDSGFAANSIADSYSFGANQVTSFCANPSCNCQQHAISIQPQACSQLPQYTLNIPNDSEPDLAGHVNSNSATSTPVATLPVSNGIDQSPTDSTQAIKEDGQKSEKRISGARHQHQQLKWRHRARHLTHRRHLNCHKNNRHHSHHGSSSSSTCHSTCRRTSIAGDRVPQSDATGGSSYGCDKSMRQVGISGIHSPLQHRASIASDGSATGGTCWNSTNRLVSSVNSNNNVNIPPLLPCAGSVRQYQNQGGCPSQRALTRDCFQGSLYLSESQQFGSSSNVKSNCGSISSSGGSSSGIGVSGSACTNTPTIATSSAAFPYGCFATRADLPMNWPKQLVQAYACQQPFDHRFYHEHRNQHQPIDQQPLWMPLNSTGLAPGMGYVCPSRKFSLPVHLESQSSERLSPNHKTKLLFEKNLQNVDSANMSPCRAANYSRFPSGQPEQQTQADESNTNNSLTNKQSQSQLMESRRSSQTITRQSSFWLEDTSLDSVLSLSTNDKTSELDNIAQPDNTLNVEQQQPQQHQQQQQRKHSSNSSQRPSLGSLVLSGDSIESVRQRSVVLMKQNSLENAPDVFESASEQLPAADTSSLGSSETKSSSDQTNSASNQTRDTAIAACSDREASKSRLMGASGSKKRRSSSSTTSSTSPSSSPDFSHSNKKKKKSLSKSASGISKRNLFGKLRARRYPRLSGSSSSEPGAQDVGRKSRTTTTQQQHLMPNANLYRRQRDESASEDEQERKSEASEAKGQEDTDNNKGGNSNELEIDREFMNNQNLKRPTSFANSASLERQCRDLWKLRATLHDDLCAGDNWSNYHQRLNRRYDSGYKSIENQLSSSLEGNNILGGGGGQSQPTHGEASQSTIVAMTDSQASIGGQDQPLEARPASGCSGMLSKCTPLLTCTEVDDEAGNKADESFSAERNSDSSNKGSCESPLNLVEAKLANLEIEDPALDCLLNDSGDRECQSRSSNEEDRATKGSNPI